MISILAPSRGRPTAARAMAESALQAADGTIEILVYADDDDPSDYEGFTNFRTVRGPRITLSDCWNKLAEQARGDILQMGSDDIRFRSEGWDTVVDAAFDLFDDRIAFVFGRDGIHDIKLGTHGFISREWLEAVGFFTWPGFSCDFADTWLDDLSQRIGRRVFLESVYVEHLHPIAGKASWDQTHRERLQRGKEQDVGKMWREIQPEREAAAERLRKALR